MRPIDQSEPILKRKSLLEQIHHHKENTPNIMPLGEVQAEKIEALFGQKASAPYAENNAPPIIENVTYRLQRIAWRYSWKNTFKIGALILVIVSAVLYSISLKDISTKITQAIDKYYLQFVQRPEFQLTHLHIEGASQELAHVIKNNLDFSFPMSSFDMDVDHILGKLEQIDAVKNADVFLRKGGALALLVEERIPVALWRKGRALDLLDVNGERAGIVNSRLARIDLPLIMGDGASQHIGQALMLFDIAKPIISRVRGLRRMGERRWDLVLDNNQEIQLPENNPQDALRRVMALHASQQLLSRDITYIDMRNQDRPILRLSRASTAIIKKYAKLD